MKKVVFTIFSIWGVSAVAQPTGGNLGQLEVSVTEEYKAQIKEANKIDESPSYSDTVSDRLPVSFSIFSEPIDISFRPEPLSPARISQIKVPDLYQGLLRAGYGFYNTPFAELYYNSSRSSKHSYGLSASHFSTQGGVQDIFYEDNAIARNNIGAFYNRFYRDYTISGQFDLNFDRYSYYGRPLREIDTLTEDASIEAPDIWYREYSVGGKIKQAQEKDLGWLSEAQLNYTHFNDNYGSQENDILAISKWLIPADDKKLTLDLNVSYFNNAYDSLYLGADSNNLYEQGTFIGQFRPHMSTALNNVIFDFGINLYAVARNDNRLEERDNALYFFPEITATYNIVPGVLSVFGGFKGDLQRNTYRQLTEKNPFIMPGQDNKPTRTTSLFAGFKGKLSKTTSFTLNGGYKHHNDFALSYRNPDFYADSTMAGLEIAYTTVNSAFVQGEINTNVNDNLLLSANALLREISSSGTIRPWNLPWFRGQLLAEYTLKDKIKIGTEIDFIGPREAFNQLENTELESMLPGYVDAHLNFEYIYNSKISAFIKLSNLLNQQYDIYLGYRAQSINAVMGFAYRF